ncbi:hypothetical protein [Streptomyces sp. NPDC051776]|uniref:hypothetical protein n=1 Tax=Streptomyces sp. NPDC051776 TaxID=3155414 RepID=UPI0034456B5D
MSGTTDKGDRDDLHRLITLCQPPLDLESSPPDRAVAGGLRIPTSHSRLIHAYGTGCFDEFMWIFADGAENKHLDITACTDETRSILRGKDAPRLREILNEYNAGPDDLVQWGVTDNGDLLTWVAVGNPDGWHTVVIQAGLLDFVLAPRSSTGVVLDLLTEALRIPFFPRDFPSTHSEFSANPYA